MIDACVESNGILVRIKYCMKLGSLFLFSFFFFVMLSPSSWSHFNLNERTFFFFVCCDRENLRFIFENFSSFQLAKFSINTSLGHNKQTTFTKKKQLNSQQKIIILSIFSLWISKWIYNRKLERKKYQKTNISESWIASFVKCFPINFFFLIL